MASHRELVVTKKSTGDWQAMTHQPDDARHPAGVADLAPLQRLQREADPHEPVAADTQQEEDAAVEVRVEEEADDLAQGHAEGPIVPDAVVVHQEGQGDHVEGVGHRQVEHVRRGGIPGLDPEEED
ncbi:UNVERIFIED_CONTAM: hypothetical protein K2H54_071620, partial [Gekko kuhli]